MMNTKVISGEYLNERKDPLRIHFRDALYRNENGELDRSGFKDRVGDSEEDPANDAFSVYPWSYRFRFEAKHIINLLLFVSF